MRELLTQLRAFYEKLSTLQKGVLLGSIAAALGGFIALLLWTANEVEYRPLFTNLTPEDAAAIMNKLKEERIPYRIIAGGSSISVPAEQVYETRLRMAGQGLPQGGGVGFELFDRANFGMTSFVQRLNYQRALQGELVRTIGQLAAVEHVRVHISMPQKSVFLEEQQKPSASVVLKIRQDAQLAKAQIQGISHLIASSVEGLRPSEVTIVDTTGKMLAGGEDSNGLGQGSSAQLEFQRGVERELERKIQGLLEKAVGPDKVSARVSAAVDFQHVESTQEIFDPNGTVIRSEQRGTEKSSGSGFQPAGPPGVAANVPAAQAATPQPSSTSELQKQNETINYEVSKSVKRVVEPVGKVKRLSAAVLIDGTSKDGTYTPRTDAEMRRFQTLARTALGFDEGRGDQVEVVNVAFGDAEALAAERAKRELSPTEFWIDIAKSLGIPVVGLVFLFLFLRSLLRRFAPAPAQVLLPRELSRAVPELAAAPIELSEGPPDEFELQMRLEETTIMREEASVDREETLVGRVEATTGRRAELARRRAEITRQRQAEVIRRREEAIRRQEEVIQEELRQRQDEARLVADAEVRQREDALRQREEAARRAQQEVTEQRDRAVKLAKDDALRAATIAREWLREG